MGEYLAGYGGSQRIQAECIVPDRMVCKVPDQLQLLTLRRSERAAYGFHPYGSIAWIILIPGDSVINSGLGQHPSLGPSKAYTYP